MVSLRSLPIALSTLLCCMLWMLMPVAATAQIKASPASPALTCVKAIQALGARQAEEQPRQVQLRGVVLFVSNKRDDFKMHDGERSIGVSLPGNAPRPQIGDTVEVEGRTNALNVQEHLYPHVAGDVVRISGKAPLPAANTAPVGALVAFQHYDQWVSAEGVVLMWTHKGTKLSLMILGPDTWAVVHVQGVQATDVPPQLHGARVRVTGVNMGISHSAADTMIVPTAAQLEILSPGTQDIFDAPLKSLEEVAKCQVPLLERIKVRGMVTAKTEDRKVYLRDGTTAIGALILHGWLRSSGSGQVYGDAGRLPDLKPGDAVELVGSQLDEGREGRYADDSLVWCHVRVTGHQPPPAACAATLPALARGAHPHDLVQLRARVLQLEQLPATNGEWRTTLMLEAGGVKLPASYQGKERDAFKKLKTDDDLQLTGVMLPAKPNELPELRLLSASAVQSLGLAASVQAGRLWLWGGSAVAVISLLGLWVIMLRRSLKHQAKADATVRELNATLEQRVMERTHELEEAKAELHRALDQERELGELKSRFVTMVSHEFRTPLGIIMSAVELMRHYEDRLPAGQRRELCEDIHSATRLMASLMEQVLVLGRVEAGKLGCRRAPLDIDTLSDKLTDECLSATNRRCPIHWQPVGSLADAFADESLLRHIFSNLITNAVKYSPEGRSVEFTAQREGTDAVFKVIDHGIGIPPADQARLFEAFYRCSNVGEIPGTGLGLVIVKRCVELHGGSLTIDSEVGRGTTFTVRLPLFASPQAVADTTT